MIQERGGRKSQEDGEGKVKKKKKKTVGREAYRARNADESGGSGGRGAVRPRGEISQGKRAGRGKRKQNI